MSIGALQLILAPQEAAPEEEAPATFEEAMEAAHAEYGRYNGYPSFRRMMDIEGVNGPAEVAIVGDETEVEQQLRTLADAGTTDLLSSVFPVGDDAKASMARTRRLLQSLVGQI